MMAGASLLIIVAIVVVGLVAAGVVLQEEYDIDCEKMREAKENGDDFY